MTYAPSFSLGKLFLKKMSFFALLNPLSLIPFTSEKITGCIDEVGKGANKAERNPPSYFFYFVFYCFRNTIN